MRRLRILTWHVHGNYLWYLSQTPHDFVLPVASDGGTGYGGRGRTFPFGSNVQDCPVSEIRRQRFDAILFQSRQAYETERHQILSPEQLRLPWIYLEHDPPWDDVTDQRHWADDPNGLLVHVTHFNRLLWDSGRSPTRVIEHGVLVPETVRYSGHIPRGILTLNHLARRGRKVGADIFATLRAESPIDLVGMASEECGGLGEVPPPRLPELLAQYRYFFSPIRYTSLGLAILEAMSVGLPVVGVASCELTTVIENGVSGYLETNLDRLAMHMRRLIDDPLEARMLGDQARQIARQRFSIDRFAADWQRTIWEVAGDSVPRRPRASLATAGGVP